MFKNVYQIIFFSADSVFDYQLPVHNIIDFKLNFEIHFIVAAGYKINIYRNIFFNIIKKGKILL